MATYRAQIAFVLDGVLPRDAQIITPHYTGSDPVALANALKTNLIANTGVGTSVGFTINVYDAMGPKPHHPLATATSAGIGASSTGPREVCLCLSYYATLNQPSLRGRVYLPNGILGNPNMLPRTPAATVTKALSYGATLFKSLPGGVVPVVFSRVHQTSAPITNYWVDDEWDTIRSRGLRPTTRQLGTVP